MSKARNIEGCNDATIYKACIPLYRALTGYGCDYVLDDLTGIRINGKTIIFNIARWRALIIKNKIKRLELEIKHSLKNIATKEMKKSIIWGTIK